MSFSEIASKAPELSKSDNKSSFDIDKRAEISPTRETSNNNEFDIDKRAEVPNDRNVDNSSMTAAIHNETPKADRESTDKGNVEYYTTKKERIDHTPSENSQLGNWDGERGESKFVPTDETVKQELETYGVDGIEYKEGVPDFFPVSETNVEIDMTSNRYGNDGNFEKCDTKCAEQWNAEQRDGKTDWTARDIAEWRAENKYTWHECSDMKTCNLVPRDIHEVCRHSGGVAECNKRDGLNSGGVFDE